jgi:hypothetical protein
MTNTVEITQIPLRNGSTHENCTICDKDAVVVAAMTPHDFASRSCHFCGGERAFCADHWLEFKQAVAAAEPVPVPNPYVFVPGDDAPVHSTPRSLALAQQLMESAGGIIDE